MLKITKVADFKNKDIGMPLILSLIFLGKEIYQYVHQFYFLIIIAFAIYLSTSFIEKKILTKSIRIQTTAVITCVIIIWILIDNYFN